MWCHLIFVLPVAGLVLFWLLPWPLASLLYVAGVAPSMLIAWVAWRALQAPPVMGMEAMAGEAAEAVTDLMPRGQVRYGNDLWMARSAEPVRKGEPVRIRAVDGILHVTPERR
jgi:membrane-bound serine protease (ClpP class)